MRRNPQRRFQALLGAADERLVLFLGAVGFSILLVALVVTLDRSLRLWSARELERRATLVSGAVEHEALALPSPVLHERLQRLAQDDRLVAIAACFADRPMVSSESGTPLFSCDSPLARAATAAGGRPIYANVDDKEIQATSRRFGPNLEHSLVVVQDRSFIRRRRLGVLQVAAIAGGLGILLVAGVLHFGVRATRRRLRSAVHDLFRHAGEGGNPRMIPSDLAPLARDLDAAVRRLRAQRDRPVSTDGPERLRKLVAERIPDASLVLVANREPYVHSRVDGSIRVDRPPSGLVTGVEPLLRACGGVWVATASGSGDRETSDARGRLAVPPDNPEYVLRRMWLTREEEEGFYDGFANEGLWPLCHIAHTRPTFRQTDWMAYQQVNRKFAAAAVEEAGRTGLILAQDYHFSLLPMEVRKMAPDAVVSLFWHIPWPNDEVFGICPWNREILDGMLGADILGFHTRYHCLNFLDTAQRYLECRVDLEGMSVEYKQRRTFVRPYPISVDWPTVPLSAEQQRAVRHARGIDDDMFVALGVDRADYTKGLLERVAAVEYLLDHNPHLVGRFLFLQLAAPTRTRIKRYRDLMSELEEEIERVNRKFRRGAYQPIILDVKSYAASEVRLHYAMADAALVTPLHDGMNLVAKEFVAARGDGRGVLVLSAFAGAAKELEGALIVNPYDSADMARAIQRAIDMPEEEERARMATLRQAIEKNTIYDWSAALLTDMAEVWGRRHTEWRREGIGA